MKKSIFCLMIACLSLVCQPIQSYANTTSKTAPVSIPMTEAEANILTVRLNEINTLDKSSLNRSEKKELRGEVKTIEKQLRASGNGGGLYLSVGAIIIIILLLIILL